MFYTFILAIHNILRWLALVAGALATYRNWQGLNRKKPWEKDDRLAKAFFVIVIDIQFSLGLILYFFLSPLTRQAFLNMGEAMKNRELRFFAVEHSFLMLAAVVLVHIGSAKIKRAKDDRARFKYGTIFFTLAMVLILLGIPWTRRFLTI